MYSVILRWYRGGSLRPVAESSESELILDDPDTRDLMLSAAPGLHAVDKDQVEI